MTWHFTISTLLKMSITIFSFTVHLFNVCPNDSPPTTTTTTLSLSLPSSSFTVFLLLLLIFCSHPFGANWKNDLWKEKETGKQKSEGREGLGVWKEGEIMGVSSIEMSGRCSSLVTLLTKHPCINKLCEAWKKRTSPTDNVQKIHAGCQIHTFRCVRRFHLQAISRILKHHQS